MSLFNHFKRSKHDKSGSSSRSTSVEPSIAIPRIIKTTDTPSSISRSLSKPHAMPADRSVSAGSDSTINVEEDRKSRSGATDSMTLTRQTSPVPERAERRQNAGRGNHIVTDAVSSFRPKLQGELKDTKETHLAAGISSESLFDFIANERLRVMPARGSRWDKILRWAEDFAKKLSLFEVTEDSFIPGSKEAVELINSCLQILLMVRPAQKYWDMC